MALQTVFERRELKYLIPREMKEQILAAAKEYIIPDEYGKSTVCSVYYDTPTSMLIRRSIESPVYKEKLRLRSYGKVGDDGRVFVEIKKKYKGIVYKRRLALPLCEAERWLAGKPLVKPPDMKPQRRQIAREVEFFLSRYENLAPAMYICSEREAYYARDDHNFRITFDEKILCRDHRLSLAENVGGTPLLDGDTILMEIKAIGAMPLWICRILSENGIFKTKFSKYGTAYKNALAAKYIMEDHHNDEFICGTV